MWVRKSKLIVFFGFFFILGGCFNDERHLEGHWDCSKDRDSGAIKNIEFRITDHPFYI